MSLECITWALNLVYKKPTQKAVLFGLANHANPTGGSCRPSIKRLMVYTGLSNSAVINAIKALELVGLLSSIKSSGKRTHYQLNIGMEVVNERDGYCSDTGVTGSLQAVTEVHQSGDGGSPEPSITINKPSKNMSEFENWWEQYRHKNDTGKKDSAGCYKRALKDATHAELADGLSDWLKSWEANGTERRYIPAASKWLKRQDWKATPPPSKSQNLDPVMEAAML